MTTTKTLATRILLVSMLVATVPPTTSPASASASSTVISVRLPQSVELDGFNAGVRAAPRVSAGPATPGERLWVKRYNAPNMYDAAAALGVSPDGSRVFVTGSSMGEEPTYEHNAPTVAYDAATGARLWVKRYYNASAAALGVSPDGSRVFVTGSIFPLPYGGLFDFVTVSYDASTGATLWAKRYEGPGEQRRRGQCAGGEPRWVEGVRDR